MTQEEIKKASELFALNSIGDTVKGKWFHARDGFIAGVEFMQPEIDELVGVLTEIKQLAGFQSSLVARDACMKADKVLMKYKKNK